ncbi:MAG TPA: LpxD N-terminal domain-containing protein, partial [Nitrospiria bacterium]|nr:LpxD N-terminal domain-containing protein [Nitrospiria bacterium]
MKKKTITQKEIAGQVGGSVIGNPDTCIDGVAGIREAREGEITFLSNAKYLGFLKSTRASAVILGREEKTVPCAQLIVENPYFAFARIL